MKSLFAIVTLLTFFLSGSESRSPRFSVVLTWSAPAPSADPVVGYDVYRAEAGSGIFTKVNDKLVPSTTWTDDTVHPGADYTWYVVSVDAQGHQSLPSRTWSAKIPNQLSDRRTAELALGVFMFLAVAGLIAVGVYMARTQRTRASAAR